MDVRLRLAGAADGHPGARRRWRLRLRHRQTGRESRRPDLCLVRRLPAVPRGRDNRRHRPEPGRTRFRIARADVPARWGTAAVEAAGSDGPRMASGERRRLSAGGAAKPRRHVVPTRRAGRPDRHRLRPVAQRVLRQARGDVQVGQLRPRLRVVLRRRRSGGTVHRALRGVRRLRPDGITRTRVGLPGAGNAVPATGRPQRTLPVRRRTQVQAAADASTRSAISHRTRPSTPAVGGTAATHGLDERP